MGRGQHEVVGNQRPGAEARAGNVEPAHALPAPAVVARHQPAQRAALARVKRQRCREKGEECDQFLHARNPVFLFQAG